MTDDLISRQYLIEAFKDEFYYMYSDDFKFMINWFKNLPAADASEFCDQLWKIAYESGRKSVTEEPTAEPVVIYCKECVYYEYKNEYSGLCDMGGEWAPDDYCSYGRKPKHG